MSKRLRSRKADTASLAPTPPTPSAVSPTRVRNIVTCSTKRRMPGAASLRSRISQPASGKACAASALKPSMVAPRREGDAIGVIDQAAGLYQAGAWQRLAWRSAHAAPAKSRWRCGRAHCSAAAMMRKVASPMRIRSPRLTCSRSSKALLRRRAADAVILAMRARRPNSARA